MTVQYSDEQILDALRKSNGMISAAAKQLKCDRGTIYHRMKDNDAFKALIDEIRETVVDEAETQLRKAVKRGEPYAVVFTLKTLGKSRGYVERQELTGADGKDLPAPIIYLPQIEHDDSDS